MHRWQRQSSRVFTRRAPAPKVAGAIPAVREGWTFPWEGCRAGNVAQSREAALQFCF